MSEETSTNQKAMPHLDTTAAWVRERQQSDPILRDFCEKMGEGNVALLLARFLGTCSTNDDTLWRLKLTAYINEAQRACGDERVTGEPLASVIKRLMEYRDDYNHLKGATRWLEDRRF